MLDEFKKYTIEPLSETFSSLGECPLVREAYRLVKDYPVTTTEIAASYPVGKMLVDNYPTFFSPNPEDAPIGVTIGGISIVFLTFALESYRNLRKRE